jgi:hypothetical protein
MDEYLHFPLINTAATVDAANIEEARPTIEAFLSFLSRFGQAELNGVEKYYKFPHTTIAYISIYPAEHPAETFERIIASLRLPGGGYRDSEIVHGWNIRSAPGRIAAFPLINWLDFTLLESDGDPRTEETTSPES